MCKGNYAFCVKINMPYAELPSTGDTLSQTDYPIMLKTIKIKKTSEKQKKYLTVEDETGIIKLTVKLGGILMENLNADSKAKALKAQGALNAKPQKVTDELFQKHDFFDSRDFVQVKYEMLRRVKKEKWAVTQASKVFGFSRPSFYKTQNAFAQKGLPGLLPRRRGPKAAHKLSDDVMKFAEQVLIKDNTLRARNLVPIIENRFGLRIHPRSIERALARKKKKRKNHYGK